MNLIIIPARYDSTRFPGKPLALINQLPMAVMTYRACEKADGFDRVVLLTDSQKIHDECVGYGIACVLHQVAAENGTERIAAYASEFLEDDDLVVDVQCDEPLMDPVIPQRILLNMKLKPEVVWTAARDLREGELKDPDVVKCFLNGDVVTYFGRVGHHGDRWAHIGVYGYSVKSLKRFLTLPTPKRGSNLEQNRWDIPIHAITVDYCGVGVDRPEHIAMVEERLSA